MFTFTLYENGKPIAQRVSNINRAPDARAWVNTTGQLIHIAPVVPVALAPWKLKNQLAHMPSLHGNSNLLADADAIIDSLPMTSGAVRFWRDPEQFPRHSETLWSLAQQLGFTQASLDDFFIAANKLEIS